MYAYSTMVRRKLSLSNNAKGQSTISSFFTKKPSPKQSNSVNGQTSTTSSCSPLTAPAIPLSIHCRLDTCAKRPLTDVDTELQLGQSLKKAKINYSGADSSPKSPDFIPATPEDKTQKCGRPSKSKCKQRISFGPVCSAQINQKKTDNPSCSNDVTSKSKLQGGNNTTLRKKTDSVNNGIQSENKNYNELQNYTTDQDPLLAEILGDAFQGNSGLIACKETNESKQLKASKILDQPKKHYSSSFDRRLSDEGPQKTQTYNVLDVRVHKITPSISKQNEESKQFNEFVHSTKPTKESRSNKDSDVILKDSTASKSSPNKEKSCPIINKRCEVKPRNIFLDCAEEESPRGAVFFVRRLSQKKKTVDKPDSSCTDSKTTCTKSQTGFSRDSGLLADLLTPDDLKNAHAIVKNNATLSALKEKLIKNSTPILSLKRNKVSQLNTQGNLSPKKKSVKVSNGEEVEGIDDKKKTSDNSADDSSHKITGINSEKKSPPGCDNAETLKKIIEKSDEKNFFANSAGDSSCPKIRGIHSDEKSASNCGNTVTVQKIIEENDEEEFSADKKFLENFEGKITVEEMSSAFSGDSMPVQDGPEGNHASLTSKKADKKSCNYSDDTSPSDLKEIISAPKEDSTMFVKPSENHPSKEDSTNNVPSQTNKSVTQRNPGDSFEDFDMECFDDEWTWSQFQADEKPEAPISYEETLDLSSAVHCKLLSIEVVKQHKESKMWLECVRTKQTASCTVRGSWLSLSLQSDYVVCVEATTADKTCSTRWMVDDTHGMLVIHPNTLISGTAVVGSLFCVRRSILSDSYRGLDGSNDVMAIGTLVHEILQEVLKKNIRKLEDIRRQAESMLTDPNTVRLCYDAAMSLCHVRKELNLFLPSIESFISRYVTIQEPTKKGNWLGAPAKVNKPKDKHGHFKDAAQEWSGEIIAIEDIEENLWDPMLGIKGKIDVTVKVRENNGNKKILPLELKTGRASHSAEHRGQVMLYSMMMSRLGTPVKSGLLLYLRESSIREVKLSHQEERDLLMLRNRLAHNLEVQSKVIVEDIENVPTLPEPINFEKACSKCPYLTICSVHLKREKDILLREGHPMKSLSAESTKHLTTAHTDYFFYWAQLIRLETQEQRKSIHLRNIWSLAPEKREKLGQALVNLRIEGNVTEDAGKFSHSFVRNHDVGIMGSQPLSDDFRKCSLNVGDYIVVSSNTRIAVDTGFVLAIDSTSICLALNRDLRKRNPNDVFHLDTYESNYATASNLTTLSCLLEDTETAKRVREAVIDRVPPTFYGEIKANVMEQLTPILANLNSAQREAAMAVLRSDHYALIKGLPGTGKTATVVALVCLLVKLGHSVLITSQTHSAVDNLLLRLKEMGVNFLRLGSAARIHPQLKEHSEGFATRNCHTPEDLALILESYQVVGVTCLGMNHPMFFRGRIFDICLVDESTQVLQSTVIRPLLNANRFVLVGDPDQLPPVVQSPRARELGLGESLFARLDTEGATKSLDLNYRMNQAITDLANNLTYKGTLKCGSSQVANAALNLPNLQKVNRDLRPSNWLSRVLSPSLSESVLFLDSCGARIETPQDWEESISSEFGSKIEAALVNFYEVKLLTKILEAVVKAGIDQNDVGVIAPYRAQVTLIRKVLEPSKEFNKIEVNSVDQYQGRDKQMILYSCTRSDTSARVPKDYEILNDRRRLTVAVTRAKSKLVIIGDESTLKTYAPFAKLFSCLSTEQKIKLPSEL